MTTGTPSAAERLSGLSLDGGWIVQEALPRPVGTTGGMFSVGYRVIDSQGGRAFLKALDYSAALASPDPARELQALTSAYNFERDLLRQCRDKRMTRIVRVVADGSVTVGANAADRVQYLIFELAEADARRLLATANAFDLAWALRALHHAATGLQQLHGAGIAHQDLKPSNLLVFTDQSAKLADLGCAAVRGGGAPRESLRVPGDLGYAPPELLYGYESPDWNCRRQGCDLYLLGSMLGFFVSGIGVTAAINARLADGHRWQSWGGEYSDVLPYVKAAFADVLREFAASLSSELRDELRLTLAELCEPDPEVRGLPSQALGRRNRYSVARYVSRFDYLAGRAELQLMRGR